MTYVLFVLLVALGAWAYSLAKARGALRQQNATLRSHNAALYDDNVQLRAGNDAFRQENASLASDNQRLHQYAQQVAVENQRLSPYRAIIDVQAEVVRLRSQANTVLGEANQQAAGVLASAHAQAQLIAGEALDAKRNVETYRLEEQAIRNRIAGYGDEYMVRAASVLDGLAEGYAHTEAGVQLKAARKHTKALLRDGEAATCDYVEPERRFIAMTFIVDAFDGKAEAVLARSKSDNFGKLRQELIDDFALVNRNGRAFRNARLTEAYLNARLEELRWAVAVHLLREQERDEQRRIKEQIREEEKARREYERAQKEAAKEEDVIRRAMERAQKEIAAATDSQRAMYESQLRELELRLREAEEKNQRALSMAQQTKRGHVYIISNVGSFGEGVFKIGLTRRLEPLDRIRELGDASVPFEFDVHAMISSDDAPALERALHRHFLAGQINKVNPRKEFFRVDLSTIREEVQNLGIQATWTMTAAAIQFRESQAIDRAIDRDPAALQAWFERQLVLDPVSSELDEDELSAPLPSTAARHLMALQEN